jgi:hypothetical protein
MQVVFPEWREGRQLIAAVASEGIEQSDASVVSEEQMHVTPELVVKLSDQIVVLIVAGTPADEQGNPVSGHATPGNLGAYWFSQKEGRW